MKFFSYILDVQHGYLLMIIYFGQYQVLLAKYDKKKNSKFVLIGKSNSLYRHDLLLLIHKSATRVPSQSNKFQFQGKFEKFIAK